MTDLNQLQLDLSAALAAQARMKDVAFLLANTIQNKRERLARLQQDNNGSDTSIVIIHMLRTNINELQLLHDDLVM